MANLELNPDIKGAKPQEFSMAEQKARSGLGQTVKAPELQTVKLNKAPAANEKPIAGAGEVVNLTPKAEQGKKQPEAVVAKVGAAQEVGRKVA